MIIHVYYVLGKQGMFSGLLYLLLAEMPGVARVEISKPAIVGRLEVSPAIDSAGPAPPNMMRF
jgi:hypothetical protein